MVRKLHKGYGNDAASLKLPGKRNSCVHYHDTAARFQVAGDSISRGSGKKNLRGGELTPPTLAVKIMDCSRYKNHRGTDRDDVS